ncbi:MAG: sigma-70 family RNA polymerase sigma factor [Hyphomonadaceae bacterium]|jgi:RNA polymerase sigma-70 factor (ECF subfamily)|nr:sigma-70 family RNA polymerase sigma factor [Hyphomonadaceae bacterium]
MSVTRPDRTIDAFLVAAAQAGERDKLEMLVRRWNRRLTAHAARLLGERELAADAVQDAWAEIMRGLPHLRDPQAFPAWAMRIVSRSCARLIRKNQKRRHLAQSFADQPVWAAETPEDTSIALADRERIRKALKALPPDQRAAVALFHFEQMSVAEVAVALDTPVGTIKTRLMHARRKLKAQLTGETHVP